MSNLKFYYCMFKGKYPVRTVTICSAMDKKEAKKAFNKLLKENGFKADIKVADIGVISSDAPHAKILEDLPQEKNDEDLLDGNY